MLRELIKRVSYSGRKPRPRRVMRNGVAHWAFRQGPQYQYGEHHIVYVPVRNKMRDKLAQAIRAARGGDWSRFAEFRDLTGLYSKCFEVHQQVFTDKEYNADVGKWMRVAVGYGPEARVRREPELQVFQNVSRLEPAF